LVQEEVAKDSANIGQDAQQLQAMIILFDYGDAAHGHARTTHDEIIMN